MSIQYESIVGMPNSAELIHELVPKIETREDIILFIKSIFPVGSKYKQSSRTSGKTNDIYIYKSKDSDLEITYRISKNPILKMTQDNKIIVLGATNTVKQQNLLEAINTKKNWEIANINDLCPHIYKTGYLEYNSYLYPYMISEKMDSDLHDYYTSGPGASNIATGKLQESDHEIAQQLISLLDDITDKLGLICFDIKPANCTINYKKGNIVVKLIDWDGDWCEDYSHVSKITLLKDYLSILNIIVMAGHFYYYLNWNIFYTYFSTADTYGRMVDKKKEALKALFCGKLKDKNGKQSSFDFIQKHYFKIQPSPAKPRSGQPSPAQPSSGQPSPAQPSSGQPSPGQPKPALVDNVGSKVSCEDAFEKIFKNVHFLNKNTKAIKENIGGKKKINVKSKKPIKKHKKTSKKHKKNI